MRCAQRRRPNYAGIATGSGSPPGSGCYRCGSPPAQLVAPGSQAPNLMRPEFADLPAVHTSQPPYLTHICEDV